MGAQRALVVLPSAEAVAQAGLHLAQQGAVRVHTPADLESLLESTHREGHRWITSPGPLALALQHGGTLVLHYDHAAACEAESLNSLFDAPPTFAGKPVHPGLKVVGLLCEGTLRKQTAAFASRFDRLVSEPLLPAVHDPIAAVQTAKPDAWAGTVIDLHQANSWREALLPHYGLDAQGEVQALPGRWAAAVATGQPIGLRNAPMGDAHFQDALRALLVAHPQAAVHSVSGYSADEQAAMRAQVTFSPTPAATAHAVNGRTLDTLFSAYAVRDGRFVRSAGLLEAGCRALHVTGDLSPQQWNRLLYAAVPLTLSLAAGVRPPPGRPEAPHAAPLPVGTWDPAAPLPAQGALALLSQDVEHTAQVLAERLPNAQVFHLAPGMQLHDLLLSLERGPTGHGVRPQGLLQALESGRPVVLRGLEQVPELRQQLDSLLRQTPPTLLVNGSLRTFAAPIVVLASPQGGVAATQIQRHRAPDSAALAQSLQPLLAALHPNLPNDFAANAYALLRQARLLLAPAQPGAPTPPSTLAALQRAASLFMGRRLARGESASPSSVGRAVCDAIASEFAHADLPNLQNLCGCAPPELSHPGTLWDRRRDRCLDLLKSQRGVFLQGPPGTGKSHVVQSLVQGLGGHMVGPVNAGATTTRANVLGEAAPVAGQTQFTAGPVAQWATDTRPGAKVLVVDEANLAPDHFWEFLRGAWDSPAHLLVDGRPVALTADHKILFTGNDDALPGRGLHPTLKEKLATVYFPALPPALVAERIAAPLAAAHAPSAALAARIDELATATYVRLRHHDSMSIRSVQEMVLRACMTAQQAGPQVSDAALHGSMLRAAAGQVSAVEAEALRHWSRLRTAGSDAPPTPPRVQQVLAGLALSGLVMVPSATALGEDLGHFLASRDFRLAQGALQAGQRALLIEGPSGRGKDVLVRSALEAAQVPHQVVNAGLGFASLRQALEIAQRTGQVLVVSELNLLPSHVLEGELNDLLTGNAHPGFALIATTNPGSFSGRADLSSALRSRFVLRSLQPYDAAELRAILDGAGHGTPQQRQAIVEHHVALSANADPGQQPTPRDALRAARLLAPPSQRNAAEAVGEAYALYATLGVRPGQARSTQPEALPTARQLARFIAPDLRVEILHGTPSSPWGAPLPQQTAAEIHRQLPAPLQLAQAVVQTSVQEAGWQWPVGPGSSLPLRQAQVALQALARHAGGEAFAAPLREHAMQDLRAQIAQMAQGPAADAGSLVVPMLTLLALSPEAQAQVEAWKQAKASPVRRAAALILELLPTAQALMQADPQSLQSKALGGHLDAALASFASFAVNPQPSPQRAPPEAPPRPQPASKRKGLRARLNRLLPKSLQNPAKAAPRVPWGVPALSKTLESALFGEGPSPSPPARWQPAAGNAHPAYFPLQVYESLEGNQFGGGRGAHAPTQGPLGARTGTLEIDLPPKNAGRAHGLYVPHGQAPSSVQWVDATGQTGSTAANLDKQGRWGTQLPEGVQATLLRYTLHEAASSEPAPAFQPLGARIRYALWPQLQTELRALRGLAPEVAVPRLNMFFKKNVQYSDAPRVKEHYRRFKGHGPDALLALRAGMCCESAHGFAAVVRDALQLPSRVVSGYRVGTGTTLGDAHAWTEVYLPKQGWTVFDPTGETADTATAARTHPSADPLPDVSQRVPAAREFKPGPVGPPQRVVHHPFPNLVDKIREEVHKAVRPLLMDVAMDVQEAYSASPTGQLDVLRLARGDAKPFIAQGVGAQERPKLLAVPSDQLYLEEAQVHAVWSALFALGTQVDVVKLNGDVARVKTINELFACEESYDAFSAQYFPVDLNQIAVREYIAQVSPESPQIYSRLRETGVRAVNIALLHQPPVKAAGRLEGTVEALSQRPDAELARVAVLELRGSADSGALERLLERTPQVRRLAMEGSVDGAQYVIPHLPQLRELSVGHGSFWCAYISRLCIVRTSGDAHFQMHGASSTVIDDWLPNMVFTTESGMQFGGPQGDLTAVECEFPTDRVPPVGEY